MAMSDAIVTVGWGGCNRRRHCRLKRLERW